MDSENQNAQAHLAGDVAAAVTLVIAAYIGFQVFDEDLATVAAGHVVAFLLGSLGAAGLVRGLLIHLW